MSSDLGGNFIDWCYSVRDVARGDVGALSERVLSELLLQLIHFKSAYGSMPQWKVAHDDVAAILGFTLERMRGVMALTSITEIRRALRVVEHEPYERQLDELIYPTTGWLGDYLDTHAGMQVPLAWHFWSAVATVGAVCQRNYVLDCGSFWIYPNHYVMVVGPTGEKKSTAIGQAENMLSAVNGRLQEWSDTQIPPRNVNVYVHRGRGSPEGFCDEIAVHEDLALHKKTGLPYERGRTQSTGIILNDEVVTILGKDQPGSSRWVELLTALYTSNSFDEPLRGRKKKYYREIAVSALLGSTMEWLRASCTPSSFEGGWMARVVYVERSSSNRIFSTPDIVDPVRVHELARELSELGLPANNEMMFSKHAALYHHDWYVETEKKRQGRTSWIMSGWFNRKDAHLRKLCMVLALCDRPRSLNIEIRHIELALKLLAVEEARLPKAFSEVVSKEPAVALQRMLDVLKKNGGSMGRTDLFRTCHRYIGDKRTLDMLIETGIATGQFEVGTDTKGPGRPRQVIRLIEGNEPVEG